jgi:hypothetical protein
MRFMPKQTSRGPLVFHRKCESVKFALRACAGRRLVDRAAIAEVLAKLAEIGVEMDKVTSRAVAAIQAGWSSRSARSVDIRAMLNGDEVNPARIVVDSVDDAKIAPACGM